MKIAIYEPIHLECIFPFCELFGFRGDQVSFFTSSVFENDLKSILKQQYLQFDFTFFDFSKSILLFRQKIHSFFNSADFDLIILNSIDFRHLLLYEALRNKKSCIVINTHDVNNFFKPTNTLHPKRLLRSLGKQLLAKRAQAFIVNAKAMQQYIVTQQYTTKPVFWLPAVITKVICPLPQSRPFIVTVPGSIDERRRDYKLVLDVFGRLAKKFPQEVKLIFAGRPVGSYGKAILQSAQELKQRGLLINFYEQEIPETDFREMIEMSTLLWSPLCINTSIHDHISETYGVTKMSGNIHDAIRYGKPLLIPDQLGIPEEIRSGSITYTSATDAVEKLAVIVQNREAFQHVAINAYQNAQHYSFSKCLATLEEMLRQLIPHSANSPARHEHQPRR